MVTTSKHVGNQNKKLVQKLINISNSTYLIVYLEATLVVVSPNP